MSVLEYLFRKFHSRQKMTYREKRVFSYLSLFQPKEYKELCHKYWDIILINSM